MTVKIQRIADKAPPIEKSRRVVVLRASWETQDKLREWAKEAGFDLAWSYSGWPQHSSNFDFHITLVASANQVRIPDEVRMVDPLTVTVDGYGVLGVDRKVPVLKIEANPTLEAMRDFFISAYGVVPTFDEFKPHISLSYKWDGAPDIVQSMPAMPSFPLVFDLLMVSTIDEPEKAKDAAAATRKVMATADRAPITGTRRTADGYLVTEARVARGGNIQDYYGHEIGEGEPNQLFKVYRPADEIFRSDSLATFAHKPVTLDHPKIEVTPDNWRKEAVGNLGSEVVRDGEFVRVPMVIMDGGAIKAIEDGTREISMGYDCELVMQSGTTDDGRSYDAFQRNIRINHCAIVPAGRAGPACRIGDQSRTPQQQKDAATMKTVTLDGKTFEVADDVATAILKDQANAKKTSDTLADAVKVIESATGKISDAKSAKADAEKLAQDAADAAEAAKKAVPTVDQVHAMAVELQTTCDAAKKIAPDLDVKGKTVSAIKSDAVAAKLGADAIKDKSADYIAAQFDMLSSVANDADPVAGALSKGGTKDGRDSAFTDFTKRYETTMGR